MSIWKAGEDVVGLLSEIKTRHHSPRLNLASVTVAFDDSKPFVRNKINLGKVAKFSPFMRLWQDQQHDFCLVIPSDLWVSVLNLEQREAYLDLQLTRCEVEYEPEFAEVAGRGGKPKKVKIKDEWGRVQYSNRMRYDDATGDPKWKVLPLDLEVFTRNVRRYGLWLDELMELKDAIERGPRPQLDAAVV